MFKYTIEVYEISGYSGCIKAVISDSEGKEIASNYGAHKIVNEWIGWELEDLHREHRESIPFPKEETLT